ncbi:MAG: DUF2459 domain-containing protein [Rhodospirillales bacterium]|nr:DUF2459 domain-containing protein [Rhodospirillales bacterium]
MLALLLTACAAPPPTPPPSQTYLGAKTVIFVTSNGWHSGIIVAKADLPPDRLPETADFPEARFFEFGWGDAVFYPAKQVTLGKTLRAALVPTPAVVHVVGLGVEPARSFPKAEVVSLPIDDENFGRLVDFVDASFERSGAARIAATGPGLYATSRFYPAKGSFHLFNTCNTWTARALAAAGFDVSASGTFRAEALMQQVRALVRPR